MELIYSIFILPIELLYKYIYLASADITGNYGVGLFVLSIISAIAFLPLAKMALASQAKENDFQDIIRPQLIAINEQYSGSGKQAAINRLYNRYAYHPIFGIRTAFGVLLQVPFLTGAYYMISALPQIKGQSFLFIHDLSLPDNLLMGLNILPILMTIINIAVVFTTKGLQRKDFIQALVIAFLFLILLYPAPSALLIFWTSNNLLFLIQNLLPVRKKKAKKVRGRVYNFFLPPVSVQDLRVNVNIYTFSLLSLILMIFLYLPSEFYLSEPEFFSGSMVDFLLSMLPYASVAVLSMMLIWLWSNNSMKRNFATVAFFLLIFTLVNKFIVVRDFGVIMGGSLTGEHKLLEANFLFRDLLAPILVTLVIFGFFNWNKVKAFRVHFIAFTCLPMLFFTGFNTFQEIDFKIKPTEITSKNEVENFSEEAIRKVHSYSKEGKNVVVLILDMFTGAHIEPMLDDPWFKNFQKDLDGFAWYPDTLSIGSRTYYSILTLYGGENYSPLILNQSNDSLAVESKNALHTLPRNFAKYNYDCSLFAYSEDEIIKVDMVDNVATNSSPNNSASNTSAGENIAQIISEKSIITFLNSENNSQKNTSLQKDENLDEPFSINDFVLATSIFQISPSMLKRFIYLDSWLGTNENYTSQTVALKTQELNQLLFFLNADLNANSKRNTFKVIFNALTHSPYHLGPDSLDLVRYPDTTNEHVESYMAQQYYTERHAMQFIINYVKQLKDLGVYDNTKIIIVSDHSSTGSSQMLNRFFTNKRESSSPMLGGKPNLKGRPHALLMVKDFNSSGELEVDPSLMTNTDAHMIALLGLPESNEYEIIDPRGQSERPRKYIFGSAKPSPFGLKYDIQNVYELTGTMFKVGNWKEYTYEDWLKKENIN